MCKALPELDLQASIKEKAFAKAYVENGGNGAEACRTAGYKDSGYLRQTAHITLKRPHVQELIRDFYSRVLDEIDVDVKRTVQETAAIAFSDIGDLYSRKNKLLNIKSIPRLSRIAIESISSYEVENGATTLTKVKMHSKLKALEMIAKYLGMYDDSETKNTEVKLDISFV